MMVRKVIYVFLAIPMLLIILHTIVRIIRRIHKFPMPEFMASLIDHPLRRKFQPPYETAVRHGLEPGMVVLEVGPGNGTYTVGAARRVGEQGRITAVDIEPKMIDRVERRMREERIVNVETRVANVHDLPFEDGMFDAVYMIAVIGEIPDPDRAMGEFHRVLSPEGIMACSELLLDPDYPLAETLVRKATAAGFRVRRKVGNFIYYTLVFEKGEASRGQITFG